MDKTLVCRDCGTNFTYTESEQEFFSSRGYSEPGRCPDCRAAKKAARTNDGYSSGGYSSDRAPRQMTQVICANCGKETEVPFVPTGDRPVYCSDCFSQMGGGSRNSSRSGSAHRY